MTSLVGVMDALAVHYAKVLLPTSMLLIPSNLTEQKHFVQLKPPLIPCYAWIMTSLAWCNRRGDRVLRSAAPAHLYAPDTFKLTEQKNCVQLYKELSYPSVCLVNDVTSPM